jgi:hypothetical protein
VVNLQHAAPNGQSIAPIAPRPDVATRPEKFVKTPLSLLFGRPDLTTTEAVCIQALMSRDWYGLGSHPGNKELMEACRFKDNGSMSRLLAGLQRKGYIRIELVPWTMANPTGRIIHLTIPPIATTDNRPRLHGDSPPPFDAGDTYCSDVREGAAQARGGARANAMGGSRQCKGGAAQARPEVDFLEEEDEERPTTTPLRGREEDGDTERLLFPSAVSRKDGGKARKASRPKAAGSSTACLGLVVESPAAVLLKTIVEAPGEPLTSPPAVKPVPDPAPGFEPPDGSLASTLDRVMERAKVEPTADVAVEAPGNDDPGEPPAERAAKPPESDHRRRLHEWIKGLKLDAVANAELVALVIEIVALLAGTRPAEGTTFDPYEQIRLALEGAVDVEAAGHLDVPIGVYARGTIRNRIKSTGFIPLQDPAIKAKAKAGPNLAELARLAAEQKRIEGEKAARIEAEKAALEGRWNSLTDFRREAIESQVRAENPTLARFKPLIHAKCLERMDDPSPAADDPPASEVVAPIEPTAVEILPVVVAAPIHHRACKASVETSPVDPDAARIEAREAARVRQLAVIEARGQARRVEPPSVVEGIVQEPERRGGDAVQETGQESGLDVAPEPIEAKSRPGVLGRLKQLVGTLALMVGCPYSRAVLMLVMDECGRRTMPLDVQGFELAESSSPGFWNLKGGVILATMHRCGWVEPDSFGSERPEVRDAPRHRHQ